MRARPRFLHARLLSAVAVTALVGGAVSGSASDDGLVASDVALAAPGGAEPTPAVEAYPDRDRQERCDPRERAGVQAFREVVLAAYPDTADGGIVRDCAIGGRSEHKEGRAWDWMLDASDPEDAAAATEVLDWLLATDEAGERHALARRLGITYVIWDGRIWSASRPDAWRPYHGASPHTDHVHISFGRDGAAGTTSFWAPVWEPEVGAAYPASVPSDDTEVRASA